MSKYMTFDVHNAENGLVIVSSSSDNGHKIRDKTYIARNKEECVELLSRVFAEVALKDALDAPIQTQPRLDRDINGQR